MNNIKKRIILLILFTFILLISINTINASSADNNTILLKSRSFVPDVGINSSTKAKIESIPDRAHVLIQLEHIPTNQEREDLETKGVELLSYIPNKGWFASIPSDKSQEIANLSIVRAITEIYPNYKLAFNIRNNSIGNHSNNGDGNVNLTVMFHEDISLVKGNEIISKYGGNITGNISIINAVIITISNQSIIDLANNDTVRWINELPVPPTVRNDGLRIDISANEMQDPPYNLKGTGVVIGQWDGGPDERYPVEYNGCVDGDHDDLKGRVTYRECDDYDGHATRVAGVMLGNGSLSEQEGGTPLQWRGVATNATVISYLVWRTNDIDEITPDYEDAIGNYNISISQNSWGWHSRMAYNEMMEAIDKIVRGNIIKPITIVWAIPDLYGAERWGNIGDADGAKNVISVGATITGIDAKASFSSLGPTPEEPEEGVDPDDNSWEFGRMKPDVMAPGAQEGGDNGITSTYTTGLGVHTYMADGGTSYAAPAVSGSVALMLEFWRRTHSVDPLPSTIKAVLIQTAKDLGGVGYHGLGVYAHIGPDYATGFGRINVTEAIYLLNKTNKGNIIESTITDQGEKDDYYTFSLPASQKELKITLVWDDYPGEPGVVPALVNDLDLVIYDPNGVRHYPWTLDPENPANAAVRNQKDDLNNVEQFFINKTYYNENPLTGTWNVSVNGTSIPEPGQTYSLVSNFPLRDSSRVRIKDSSGEKVAWFGNLGNIVLKGSCAKKDICNAPDDSLVFKNANGVEIAHIDPNGNLCIVTGDCSDNSPSCDNPTGDSFIIKEKWSIHNSIYIDITGDLCLIGTLYENSDATMLNL